MAYPTLEMPAQFARRREDWSKDDARAVLAWLGGLIEPRTDRLLERLEMCWADRPNDWLERVETGIRARIWTDAFWAPSSGPETIVLRVATIKEDLGPRLSAPGEALGLDLGLLLGRSFATHLDGDGHWIVGGHGRTYVSHNLPVFRGRGRAEYDPILIGLDLARRYLPDHAVTPHELRLGGVHDLWLRNLSDATWGAKYG
jgi:hypothetical protein